MQIDHVLSFEQQYQIPIILLLSSLLFTRPKYFLSSNQHKGCKIFVYAQTNMYP